MSPRTARAKIDANRDKQRAFAALSARERLARAIGPQAFYATAEKSGVDILFVRPDLVALTKHKDWPQPLTGMARTLVYEGDRTLRVPEKLDQYLELQHRIIVELARVEPAALLEANAADDAEFAERLAAWNEGDKKGKAPVPTHIHRDNALQSLDTETLKPLFVLPGGEPDEDQLVLLIPGDNQTPSLGENSVRLTIQDLLVLTGAVLSNQAGSLARFRD